MAKGRNGVKTRDYYKPRNNKAGVSIKIEVASNFEKSNRLYQKEAFTPLHLEGSGGVLPLKISKFQCLKMRFPAFWTLN